MFVISQLFGTRTATNTYLIPMHIWEIHFGSFQELICRFRFFQKSLKLSQTHPKWSPTHSHTCPKQVQQMSGNCPKHVRQISKNMSKQVSQTCPKNIRTCVPHMSQNILKCPTHTIQNHSRPCPESNPVPSGSDSRTGSASQPIGLIPSQDKGSPTISYVSKLETKTHRNNLVAEKVTWAFSEIKKALFWKTSIVLILYVPAGFLFPPKKTTFQLSEVFLIYFTIIPARRIRGRAYCGYINTKEIGISGRKESEEQINLILCFKGNRSVQRLSYVLIYIFYRIIPQTILPKFNFSTISLFLDEICRFSWRFHESDALLGPQASLGNPG